MRGRMRPARDRASAWVVHWVRRARLCYTAGTGAISRSRGVLAAWGLPLIAAQLDAFLTDKEITVAQKVKDISSALSLLAVTSLSCIRNALFHVMLSEHVVS